MKRATLILFWVAAAQAQPLPGTTPLSVDGDLAAQMVAGIDRYLMRELAASPERRRAMTPSRERLRTLLGVVDPRVAFDAPLLVDTVRAPARAPAVGYTVRTVRWPVLDGLDAEGLLLSPRQAPVARVVALPDADWTPEMFSGLAPGVPTAMQFARILAEYGCEVLVPALIDRRDTWSGNPAIRFTNQPHREFIHRMAWEMGRTITGYEVQKTLAAVDWFARSAGPIAVAGYGEGGLVALASAALDTRITAALVSGYFQPREQVWREPIYRDVWAQLNELGDAEIASLAAPRALVIEASSYPEVGGPPPERDGRRGAAPGRLTAPALAEVRVELARVRGNHVQFATDPGDALAKLTRALGFKPAVRPAGPTQHDSDPDARHARQFRQMVEFTQTLVRRSDVERAKFWSRAGATTESHRKHLWEEVLGKLPAASEPLAARSRLIYDRPAFRGYEVTLPVLPDVFAYGILLLPKDLKAGERRPVVVAQHGLEGRPQDLIVPPNARMETTYAHYAAQLAERGFIVYAPQNPYIGGESFRVLLRKAHPLKLSLFSFILAQHERTLEWLSAQPFVDPARIGFYGLSYGGKTAMRVPSLLPQYALSICSADFNEWIWKITSVDQPFSYMFTLEYDMLEFNLGNTFNYAEMARLIAPRPFMVERGHADGVGIDEWVAYEYAKVRRYYTQQKIADRTTIEFFDGPHQIHGVGTFEFLHRHLRWPIRSAVW